MLELIYEEQLQPKTPHQQLSEHHQEILGALNSLRSAFLKTKLWYKAQRNDFYDSQLQKLEQYEEPFEQAREKYINMWLLPHEKHMNHPPTKLQQRLNQ